MKAIIKRAIAEDLSDIIGLMQEHAEFERAPFDAISLDKKLKIALVGKAPKVFIFIAQVNKITVGYCSLVREFSSWKGEEYMHMDCLYINEKVRGLRIGQQLIDTAFQFTRNQDIFELQWQTPAWNENAIRFYQRLGVHSNNKLRFVKKID